MKKNNVVIEKEDKGYWLIIDDEPSYQNMAVSKKELLDIKECIAQMLLHGELEED